MKKRVTNRRHPRPSTGSLRVRATEFNRPRFPAATQDAHAKSARPRPRFRALKPGNTPYLSILRTFFEKFTYSRFRQNNRERFTRLKQRFVAKRLTHRTHAEINRAQKRTRRVAQKVGHARYFTKG